MGGAGMTGRQGGVREPRVSWLGRVGFDEGLRIQERELAAVEAGESVGTVFLLEHEPVYTIGRTRNQSSLGVAALLPHPVREINRGGQATYHGPGQLVGYPVLPLEFAGRDLHRYLRFLEEVLLETAARFGVRAQRREGLTGMWVEERKIASIGVGVRRWISMHGFALNVTPECLEGFRHITPCGLAGVRMTDLTTESGRPCTVQEAAAVAGEVFGELWPRCQQAEFFRGF